MLYNILTVHLLSRHGTTTLWEETATAEATGVPSVAKCKDEAATATRGGGRGETLT